MQPKESKSNWHFNISLFKSCLRIIASVALIKNEMIVAGCLLMLAEMFGILEEF